MSLTFVFFFALAYTLVSLVLLGIIGYLYLVKKIHEE